ncbi:MAG: hypothetical protein IIB61_06000 [Planctomycetes bacterium]|nr:hypothetical protein [Planctomycetota bacterium]
MSPPEMCVRESIVMLRDPAGAILVIVGGNRPVGPNRALVLCLLGAVFLAEL